MTYDPNSATVRDLQPCVTAPEPLAPAPVSVRFRAEPRTLKAAQNWAGFSTARPRGRRIEQVYFDTPQAALASHNMALHLCGQQRRHVLTLETLGEAFEVPLAMPEPAYEALGAEAEARISQVLDGEALQPVFTLDIKRVLRHVKTPSGVVEVAFDSGVIRNPPHSLPVYDITLALKAGDPTELTRVGLEFAAAFPRRLGCQTTLERGAQLVSGMAPTSPKVEPGLQGAPTVDAAISLFITGCLTQFTANFPVFEQGDAERAVHQMRVAMRRLRSVLGVFERAFPSAEFAAYRSQARAIAATLGQARDWDVFQALVGQGPRRAFPDETGFAALMAGAGAARAAGYAQVRALLDGPEVVRFVLGLQGFAARHGWRNAVAGEALAALAAPAAGFGQANLARQHRKIARRGKRLAALPPQQRHEIRKQLKKLRYTAEFFGGQPAAYIRAAAALQDRLGAANDAAGAIHLAARLQDADPATCRAAGIVMGYCGRDMAGDGAALRKAWKKFRRAKIFR